MQVCFCARTVGQNYFNHCGGPVKLVQAFSCAGKVRESHFNHCGGHVKLVQACLNATGDEETIFSLLWRSCEARAGLSKCQEIRRK